MGEQGQRRRRGSFPQAERGEQLRAGPHPILPRNQERVQVREREPRAEEVPAPLHLPPAVHPVPDRGVGGGRTNIFCFFGTTERESATILFFFGECVTPRRYIPRE